MSNDSQTRGPRFKVTYLNHLDGKRHELIGDIDSVTADAVISKYGNTQCPCFYLDGVLKESMS